MTDIIEDSFKSILTILRYVGIYYDDKQVMSLKIWVLYLYLSCVLVTTLTFVSLLTGKVTDIMQINQMVTFLASAIVICIKYILLVANGTRVKQCVKYFGDDRFAPKDHQEQIIIEDCHRVCKRNYKIYSSVLYFADIGWITLPLFENEPRLPIPIWLPYQPTTKPVVFWPTYLWVVSVLIYFGIVAASLEPLLGGLAYHATSQLRILKYNLCNLGKHEKQNDGKYFTVNYENLFMALRQCIIRHKDILNFVAEYENCFSWCTFCQTAATTFSLGFCCVGLSLVSPTSLSAAIFVSSYFVVAAQFFFYCHYGTLLYEENETLINAIYASSWYKYDTTVRKILLVVMERSKSPLILSAGKVIELTHQTFISVLKISYSFIAIMNNTG